MMHDVIGQLSLSELIKKLDHPAPMFVSSVLFTSISYGSILSMTDKAFVQSGPGFGGEVYAYTIDMRKMIRFIFIYFNLKLIIIINQTI